MASMAEPIELLWVDEHGPMRVMTRVPVEGYVMVRRPSCAPFVMSVKDLRAKCTPRQPLPKINVRERVSNIMKATEAN